MILLPSFQLASRLNSQNTNETEFINELLHKNLFMNIGISKWHNRIFDLTYIFLTLFQFLTRFLNSTHLKLFSTYLVVQNGRMWKAWFSAPRNAKKENQLKHKNQVRNRLFVDRSSSMYYYTCNYEVSTSKKNVYNNFNKNNENLEIFCLGVTVYLNIR